MNVYFSIVCVQLTCLNSGDLGDIFVSSYYHRPIGIINLSHSYFRWLNDCSGCTIAFFQLLHIEPLRVIFFFIFAIYGVVCVPLTQSSCAGRENIFVTHLSIIKSEVSTMMLFTLLLCSLSCVEIIEYIEVWRSYSLLVYYSISLSS